MPYWYSDWYKDRGGKSDKWYSETREELLKFKDKMVKYPYVNHFKLWFVHKGIFRYLSIPYLQIQPGNAKKDIRLKILIEQIIDCIMVWVCLYCRWKEMLTRSLTALSERYEVYIIWQEGV